MGSPEPIVTYCTCDCHGPPVPQAVIDQAIREIVAMLHDIPLKFVRPPVEDTTGAVD